MPSTGFYQEILNTDAQTYGGGNVGNQGGMDSEQQHWQGREHSLILSLPPLSVVGFKRLDAKPALEIAPAESLPEEQNL